MSHDWRITAQAIQKRLLPGRQLTFEDLRCETYYRPYQGIGGDYSDFVCLDRRRVGLAIGDVSGKGVGAALMMANLQASLTYVNAGHNPPLILRQERGRVRLIRLESEGPPVGLFRNTVYKGCVCPLRLGDLLVAYTDGITESSNEMQELWGATGLETKLSECIGKRPAEIIEAIVAARDGFAGFNRADR